MPRTTLNFLSILIYSIAILIVQPVTIAACTFPPPPTCSASSIALLTVQLVEALAACHCDSLSELPGFPLGTRWTVRIAMLITEEKNNCATWPRKSKGWR